MGIDKLVLILNQDIAVVLGDMIDKHPNIIPNPTENKMKGNSATSKILVTSPNGRSALLVSSTPKSDGVIIIYAIGLKQNIRNPTMIVILVDTSVGKSR